MEHASAQPVIAATDGETRSRVLTEPGRDTGLAPGKGVRETQRTSAWQRRRRHAPRPPASIDKHGTTAAGRDENQPADRDRNLPPVVIEPRLAAALYRSGSRRDRVSCTLRKNCPPPQRRRQFGGRSPAPGHSSVSGGPSSCHLRSSLIPAERSYLRTAVILNSAIEREGGGRGAALPASAGDARSPSMCGRGRPDRTETEAGAVTGQVARVMSDAAWPRGNTERSCSHSQHSVSDLVSQIERQNNHGVRTGIEMRFSGGRRVRHA